ncbi:hypothetical protein PQ469_24445 [Mucilaginibacter sp. KACC 22773]|uniref:hypothetical protein n=1 Tax=Mucilaginibacter sp. KACC 22773 TaxID=3025671 RepID=UPI0023666746|nr:hypothetical protein [Mucilaginibacter sp. KACC 22773]WDF77037.1 hypothetical protein PQ469_24445 [Mucilaginibacter sp. KACC 22773]
MKEETNEVQLPDYLLVHPELKDDPVNKQGQIGIITAAILNTDEFFVGFDDKEVGLYSADALLTFKEPGEIYDFMHKNALTLSVDTFKDLKSIALLLDYGTKQHQRTALEMVQKDPELLTAALITLEKSLGLDQAIKRGR